MDKIKICAVIVTYNRKELLTRCLEAVKQQTYKVDDIYIIDNASTDGTSEHLEKNNAISTGEITSELLEDVSIDQYSIHYYRLSSNQGGAGGFYNGIKLAHESKRFDAYWLMDDDGYPSKDCLERQLPYLMKHDYVMPVSIDINNHERLSWATRKRNGEKTTAYSELKQDWGEVMSFIFPFNGSLMSRQLVEKVGYINPKLFIWGDDYEHYYRCLNNGFAPITAMDALFYHPVNKAPTIPIFFGKVQIPYVDSNLRFVCLIRNWAYINKKNNRYLHLLKSMGAYTLLFLFSKKMDWNKYKLFLLSFKDGLVGNFERHKQFI